jgi:Tfp pilus assembly protein PilN
MINVNLLPPEIRAEQKTAKENRKILRLIFMLGGLFVLLSSIFGGQLWYFNNKLNEANQSLAQKEQSIKKYVDVENKSKKISERINTIGQIMDNSNNWSKVLEEIQTIMPSGVTLSNIKIDSSGKTRNTITGYALSKKEVAALREAMDNSGKFEYVDIESSSTESNPNLGREVENFTITFALTKGALK